MTDKALVNYLLADYVVVDNTRLCFQNFLISVANTGKIAFVNSYNGELDGTQIWTYPQFYTTFSIYFKALDVLVPANHYFTLLDKGDQLFSFHSMRAENQKSYLDDGY